MMTEKEIHRAIGQAFDHMMALESSSFIKYEDIDFAISRWRTLCKMQLETNGVLLADDSNGDIS